MIPWEAIQSWLDADDGDEDQLVDARDRVIEWIEGQTYRHFGTPTEFVERADGGHPDLWLREEPLTPGQEDGFDALAVETRDDGEWESVDAGDYERIGHVLWHDDEWPGGQRDLRVTYTAGYEIGELPGDIQQLVLEMLASWWRDRGKENVRSETIGGYSYTRWGPTMSADQMPSGWRETLDRYRRATVGP